MLSPRQSLIDQPVISHGIKHDVDYVLKINLADTALLTKFIEYYLEIELIYCFV
jgi:hypothetical protein